MIIQKVSALKECEISDYNFFIVELEIEKYFTFI